MFRQLESMVDAFAKGQVSRREMVAGIAALIVGSSLNTKDAFAETASETKPTFAAKGLNHIALRVKDVAKSRDWYRKHLGLRVMRDSRQSCFMRTGDHFLALFRGDKPGMDHYCYTVDNYDAGRSVDTLKAAGLTPTRHDNRVYFRDPDDLEVQVAGRNDWSDFG